MIQFNMIRGRERVAQVIVLDTGKCIVSWPTSVIVYDDEKSARAVHIDHMGGRGEKTYFSVVYGDAKGFMRGVNDAIQDDCENCVLKELKAPDYITPDEVVGWRSGYARVQTHFLDFGSVL